MPLGRVQSLRGEVVVVAVDIEPVRRRLLCQSRAQMPAPLCALVFLAITLDILCMLLGRVVAVKCVVCLFVGFYYFKK